MTFKFGSRTVTMMRKILKKNLAVVQKMDAAAKVKAVVAVVKIEIISNEKFNKNS